nr:NADH deshydrogenase subunit 4 [Euceros serricornis]
MNMSLFFFFFILKKINKIFIQLFFKILLFMNLINLFFMLNFQMNFWNWIYYDLAIDMYSFGLISLSLWIFILMMMVSNNFFSMKNYLYFMFLMNFMLILVILCFSTMNLLIFYMAFESSLLPVFFLILGWGHQPERVTAAFHMLMYTLFGSLPLLFMIVYIYFSENTNMMNLIYIDEMNYFMFMSLTLGFFMKMPMYFFHLWLPKAHVESPIMGSMILAGVMLKLGSYGLLRTIFMIQEVWIGQNFIYVIYCLMSAIILSLICLCQNDMKMLVAYSSVVHMGILMSGMLTLNNWGISGSYLMMIAHGLVSSGMFCLVNLMYERFKSRSMFINKGLINMFPSLTLLWFLICSSNLSFPPSLNLFSEIMLFNSLIIYMKSLILISMMVIFFSSCYNLFFYSYSQYGKNLNIYMFKNIKIMEFMLLLFHWIPLNFMFNWMYLF